MERVSTTLLGRFWLDPTVSSFVASLRASDKNKTKIIIRQAEEKVQKWEEKKERIDIFYPSVHPLVGRLLYVSQ